MDRVEHQLQQFRGAPGQGAIVKQALQTFFDEIMALKNAPAMSHRVEQCACSCAVDLGARVAAIELVMAGPADDGAVVLQCEAPPARTTPRGSSEECPPLAVAAVLAPVIVPICLPLAQSALGNAPAVAAIATRALSSDKAPSGPAEVAGHYSVSTSPNGPPVLPHHSTEEGSSEDIEAILLQAEATQVDRFLSLAQHQKATSEKV